MPQIHLPGTFVGIKQTVGSPLDIRVNLNESIYSSLDSSKSQLGQASMTSDMVTSLHFKSLERGMTDCDT